jgi:phosphate transport system substrate-binding protein
MSSKILVFVSTLIAASMFLGACAPATTPTVAPTVVAPKAAEPTMASAPATAAPAVKPTDLPAGSVTLNGAGATFPLPVYTEWIYAYQYVDPSVLINYQGIGSGGGKKGIIDNTLDFAGSDSVLSEAEYTSGKDLQMFPMLAGAVVPIYNIKGVKPEDKPLILDRATLVGIYDGSIKNWNDPKLVALNPDLAKVLSDAQITAVHRSDGSGTTEIFTNALAAFSPDWLKNVGAAASVEWPVDKAGNGIGGKGNQGVAAAVQNTPNSIGYVELSYAVSNKIAFAQMVNKAGTTVTAKSSSLAADMADFADSFNDKLTAKIVDGAGKDSWPISGYTYLIFHMSSMTDCVKAQKMIDYVNWSLTDKAAAKRAADLGYSVLPDAVRTKVLAKMGELTCNGQKVTIK